MNPPTPTPKQVIPLERLRYAASGGSEAKTTRRKIRPNAAPDMSAVIYCLESDHPMFREPEKGELIVGLYRKDDGMAAPILLWADPNVDLFWDVGLRQHVKPPAWYVRIGCQPQIDAETGYPVIHGAVCPF